MKVTTFAKASVSASAAAALALGLTSTAFAVATPPTAADEDAAITTPVASTTLVGVGSDTTQDVMYGIAQAINTAAGKQVIASFTATGGSTITYRSGKVANRPNGSGAGFKALTDSIGLTAAGNANINDVDFSRASGAQAISSTVNSNGTVTDVPFATDAVSLAVPAGSPFLLTNGGKGVSITDLVNIYTGTDTYVTKADGALVTQAAYDAAADKSLYLPINAFVPKAGSGSRQFFLAQLATQGGGINLTAGGSTKGDGLWPSTTPPTGTDPYIGAVGYGATGPVQEHDATVLTSAPATAAAIAPFSGAKFIGYHNHTIADPDAGKVAGTDYQLVPLFSSVSDAAALPYTGDASTDATLAPDPAYVTNAKQGGSETPFALTRLVYNVIPAAAWRTPTASAKLQLIHDTFVGTTSSVCQQTAAIQQYGFLPLTASSGASSCGDTSRTFDAPSTATVLASSTTGTAGKSATVTVGVQSNGNGGGTVKLTAGGKDYTGTIAAGATSTSITIPTPTVGSLGYTGVFTPALAGVATTQVPAGTIAVKAAPIVKVNPVVRAVAPKVSHTKRAKVTVTVTASGTVPTGKVTVVVKKRTRTLVTVANKGLVGGKAVVTLTKRLKKGSYTVYVSYTGDAKVKPAPLRALATLKVT
ncbi:hypothetical protein JCM18899A_45550 [Nocardioides sp. AN3]